MGLENLRGIGDENFPEHYLLVWNDKVGDLSLACSHPDCDWIQRKVREDDVAKVWFYLHGSFCTINLNL